MSTPSPQAGSGGRYTRSASGLVAAMIVTVLVVVGFVVLRGLVSRDLEVEPEAVEYLEVVEQAQDADIEVFYPPALPEGWIATTAEVEPSGTTAPPDVGITMLTGTERFLGVRQSARSAEALLDELVDEDVEQLDDYTSDASVTPTWQAWDDEGGDLAYTATLDDVTVIVYGSAGAEALQLVVDALTDAPVGG